MPPICGVNFGFGSVVVEEMFGDGVIGDCGVGVGDVHDGGGGDVFRGLATLGWSSCGGSRSEVRCCTLLLGRLVGGSLYGSDLEGTADVGGFSSVYDHSKNGLAPVDSVGGVCLSSLLDLCCNDPSWRSIEVAADVLFAFCLTAA